MNVAYMYVRCVAVCFLALAVLSVGIAATRYEVVDLRAYFPSGTGVIDAHAINNKGHVVGSYSELGSPFERAFIYDGQVKNLGVLGTPQGAGPGIGASSAAYGINDDGAVVGISTTATQGERHAFLYRGGTMVDLGALPGERGSTAVAINRSGMVAGRATASRGDRGVVWTDGQIMDLGTLGGRTTWVTAINNLGQVTGYSPLTDESPPRAFLRSEGALHDLGTLGGDTSVGYAINDAGQVAGFSFLKDVSGGRAVLFSAGAVIDVGTLGGLESMALGINNEGDVVGWSHSTAVGGVAAFIYSRGKMHDLNTLVDVQAAGIERLHEAIAINDRGQILCSGSGKNGSSFFLLTPEEETKTEGRISAFSIRARAGSGEATLIGGLVLASGGQSLLLRGVGPALANLGVSEPIADPMLTLFRGASSIAANNDWDDAEGSAKQLAAARTGAFPLPSGSKDAALVAELPSTIYTFHVSAGNGEGIALAEFYELDSDRARLRAVSGRCRVYDGENVGIAGVVITGEKPRKLLIRAVGPGLEQQGVTDVLRNPQLRVIRNGVAVAENDDWGSLGDESSIATASAAVGLHPLNSGSGDSAIVALLQPGVYTVVVSGVSSSAGVVLLELYDLG